MYKKPLNLCLISLIITCTGCASVGQLGRDLQDIGEKAVDGTTEMVKNGVDRINNNSDPEQNEQNRNKIIDFSAIGFGVASGLVCAATVGKKNGQLGVALCAVGGLAIQQVISFLGKEITAGLKESEQREILVAASKSLKTGEPVTVDLPESNTSINITPSADIIEKSVTLPIQIDSDMIDKDLPLLHVIGSAYKVKNSTTIYSSESKQSKTTIKASKNQEVHVLGRAGTEKKLLAAVWIQAQDESYPTPMAIGYILEDELIETESELEESMLKKAPPSLTTVDVDAIVSCRQIEFKRKNPDGKIIEDKTLQCNGPNGIPIDI